MLNFTILETSHERMVSRGIVEVVLRTYDFDSLVDCEYIQSLTATVQSLVVTGFYYSLFKPAP